MAEDGGDSPVEPELPVRHPPPVHSRSTRCDWCATLLDAYRGDDWIRRDGKPEYSEREIFQFDRPDEGPCNLCGESGTLGMTLDVWLIGSERGAPANRVLTLAVCAIDRSLDRWSTDDWRWVISGASGVHH